MKILILFLVYTVVNADEFGTPYLLNRRLCDDWSCVNRKLGLPNTLPAREQYSQVLKGLLPGTWHDVVDQALDGCYVNRTRMYTNACPGQALMHCALDQLIERCPEENLRKNDRCSPVTSLAGFKYMFSQGLYENFEANIPFENRPSWFMKHYFSAKCCNLPEIFNASVLSQCGFTKLMHYYKHAPKMNITYSTTRSTTTESLPEDFPRIVYLPESNEADYLEDPLNCCDISNFVDASSRSECDFKMNWDGHRLSIAKPSVATTTVPTTTATPRLDVKVLPVPCSQEQCVFRKLNIIDDSGAVNSEAFSILLNNLTSRHPEWNKAKARVVTKCLSRNLRSYKEECEINKVLACTFDVLSENCPNATKSDPCKHPSTLTADGVACQISSSMFTPKNRHQYCEVPSLVSEEVMSECGIQSITRLEYSMQAAPVRKLSTDFPDSACKTLTDPTKCVLSKMGILNKYGFMDYFKMKDRIRDFATKDTEWLALNDAFLSAFAAMPLYKEYCSSPKKLLNVLDAMLKTCPISKRKTTPQCYKMFNELSQNRNEIKSTNEIRDLFPFSKSQKNNDNKEIYTVPNKLYDFGLLHSDNVPPVRIIDVNHTVRPIKVVLPVYQQVYDKSGSDMTINSLHRDGIWRGGLGNLVGGKRRNMILP